MAETLEGIAHGAVRAAAGSPLQPDPSYGSACCAIHSTWDRQGKWLSDCIGAAASRLEPVTRRRFMHLTELSRYLPTRDEMARIIASRACYTSSDLTGALLIGAAIGAGMALFYAPKSGRELRGQVSGRVQQMRNGISRSSEEGVYAHP
jgi:hypothetical protein